MRSVHIIGVASGWGAADRHCESGPDALRVRGLVGRLRRAELPVTWRTTLRPHPPKDRAAITDTVVDVCTDLAEQVKAVATTGHPFVVLGGDHSIAIGTWSGARQAVVPGEPFGLIWIDAHMDSHVAATSPSGALHGMPVACLLGHGDPRLTGIGGEGPVLQPEHLWLIGVRSYEADEAELLQRLGVRVIPMEEVQQRGMTTVMNEALHYFHTNTAGFGISIDLDGIDPDDAPGVSTPTTNGIAGNQLVHALRQARGLRGLMGIEIAEYSPFRDTGDRTAQLIQDLILATLLQQRRHYEQHGN